MRRNVERMNARQSGEATLILLVVILLVFGIVVANFWFGNSTQPSIDAGREVAEAFLNHLQQGKPADAWMSTTAEFKSAQGKESFVADMKPLKFFKTPLDFVSTQAVEIGPEQRSEYLYRAKTGETVRLVLGREDGQWKVDRWLL